MQGKAFYSLLLFCIWWSYSKPAMLLISRGEIGLYISLKIEMTECYTAYTHCQTVSPDISTCVFNYVASTAIAGYRQYIVGSLV